MTNMLRRGSEWLSEQRHEHMTDTIGYMRDGFDEISIGATVGRTTSDRADSEGLILQVKNRDFIIRAQDLILGGSPTKPARGDLLTETDADGTKHVFEVAPLSSGEPAFEYADQHRKSYRIHTKKLRTEEA